MTKKTEQRGRKANHDISNSTDKILKLEKSNTDTESPLTDLPLSLSPKEKNVLEFLELYMREHGISPTYQEICNHFGFASFNSVQRYLKQLESKGYIKLPWANQKRAITLLKPASALQSAVEKWHEPNTPSSHAETHNRHGNVTPAIMSSENFSLPLLGRVAAGAPIEALEHDEFIDVPASLVRRPEHTYALRVQGQSMIDDGILDGDVILVQKQTRAESGEIVVAMVGEEATVKRFYLHRQGPNMSAAARTAWNERFSALRFDGDESDDSFSLEKLSPVATRKKTDIVELRPANSSMSPMWFMPDEVQIRGVVVGLIRRFF